MKNEGIPNLAQICRTIGKNVRNKREEKGMKREDLEAISDIPTSYLGCIERGETNPGVKTLVKLCNALGMGLTDLFDDPSVPLLKAAHMEEYAEQIMTFPGEKRETLGTIIRLLFKLINDRGEKKIEGEISGGTGAAVPQGDR